MSATNNPSIHDLLTNAWESLAATVEHPDCPEALICEVNAFIAELCKAAEEVNASAVEAAKLRHLMPHVGEIITQRDGRRKLRRVA